MQAISKVVVLKTLAQGHFESVMVKIGSESPISADQITTMNTQCGDISPFRTQSNQLLVSFVCLPPISGRYLTLQQTVLELFHFREIFIFTKGKQRIKCA